MNSVCAISTWRWCSRFPCRNQPAVELAQARAVAVKTYLVNDKA